MTRILDVRSGQAHSQVILTASGVALVDAGSDPKARAIRRTLSRAEIALSAVRWIVLTHGDGDHVAGARDLQDACGAQVIAHELEVEYVMGRVPPGFPVAKRAFGLLGSRLPRPSELLPMTGERLDLGPVEIRHAPGHTPGHIVVYAGDAICAGDAFRTGDRFREVPRALTVDVSTSRETLRRLAGRPTVRAFSGHGPPSDDASARLAALVRSLPEPIRSPS
jgi:glyoxylase-like metal-dependent hydrolase (beta-lactamase superfamily II)